MASRVTFAVLGGLVVVAIVVWAVLAPRTPDADGRLPESSPRWAGTVPAPVPASDPSGGLAGLVDPEWLAATAERTGIPERALAAYAGAALVKAEQMPSCGLGWNTLAAIGYVESRHGTHGGSSVGDDGTVSPPIIGVALDGGSTEVVTDTDEGAIDGDPVHDRAVGPMQLIPQTWRNWHVDANGDGVEDPQNVDDATVATANYLCRASGDMGSEAGWRAGVSAYNGATTYIDKVAVAGAAYAG